jgi:hypothetical protein
MIATATARNADHVARGAASFATGDLATADLGDRCFDKVFAIPRPGVPPRSARGRAPIAQPTR